MVIRSYYLEIKNRSILTALAWASAILVSYVFKEVLLFSITKQTGSSLPFCMKEVFYFIFTDITEIFSVYVTLLFFLGNQVLIFYFFYHVLIFIALGLYAFEYNYLVFVYKTILFLYFFSIVIYNELLFPLSFDFFISFQNFTMLKSLTLHFEAKLSEYVTFYITFYYISVLYFQAFMFLILFFDYFKNELRIVQRFRKFLYYFFVIFSTLITPPDVFSQLVLSICLIFSYEIFVFYFVLKGLIR